MNKPRIGIVIVNYNGAKFQNECIQSILESSYDNYLIIVVDNGSKDNSMEMLSSFNSDKIITIYNNDNLGVAEGNNVGIKKSLELCDATLMLNNDTVLSKNTLEILAKCSASYDVISPKILFWDSKKIWYFGGSFIKNRGRNDHWNYEADNVGFDKDIVCEYAPTCCLLVNNKIINKIGLMDAKFFLYYDDADFCMRMKLNNYPIYVSAETVIYHKVSSSTGGDESPVSLYYMNRNRFYFLDKYKKEFGLKARLFTTFRARYKLIFGNKNEKYYIKKALYDYKHNRLGRCDDLFKEKKA